MPGFIFNIFERIFHVFPETWYGVQLGWFL